MRPGRRTRAAPTDVPEVILPCRGGVSTPSSARGRTPVGSAGRSSTIQWTKSLASGSSTRSTSESAPAGTPDQLSAGETLSPSQVYSRGMAPPSMKADDVSRNGTTGPDGAADPDGAAEPPGEADGLPPLVRSRRCRREGRRRRGRRAAVGRVRGFQHLSLRSRRADRPARCHEPEHDEPRHREPSPERSHPRRASPPAPRVAASSSARRRPPGPLAARPDPADTRRTPGRTRTTMANR